MSNKNEGDYKFKLQAEVATMISVVGKDGYFIGSNVLAGFDLESIHAILANWGNADKIHFHGMLKKVIHESIHEIRKQTLEIIPRRYDIIKSIFNLYENSDYIPLVPLILTQVDGIVNEMTNGYAGFFAVSKGKLKFLDKPLYVDFFSNVAQLDIQNRNDFELFKAKVEDYTEFNRHAILHGESTVFGSEQNAVKAMSLFQFISELYYANSPHR